MARTFGYRSLKVSITYRTVPAPIYAFLKLKFRTVHFKTCLSRSPDPTQFQVTRAPDLLWSRRWLEMLEGVQPRLGQLSHRGRQLRALAQIQEQVEQAFQILRSWIYERLRLRVTCLLFPDPVGRLLRQGSSNMINCREYFLGGCRCSEFINNCITGTIGRRCIPYSTNCKLIDKKLQILEATPKWKKRISKKNLLALPGQKSPSY